MTGGLPWLVAVAVGSFLAGRASMARQVAEHDRQFNSRIRRLAFRFARAAYPKEKRSKVVP